jgi:nicotinate-nucleotide adenylyltransferase
MSKSSKPKKIALYFGSFNPVHIGHLAIANYIAEMGSVDEVWMVVSPHNPLKKKESMLANHHRLTLVKVAIGDYPNIKASDIEFYLPSPSYTINTLAHLKEKFPLHNFSLIIGADNLHNFHKWKNYELILATYQLLVYPRPGFETHPFLTHPNVSLLEAPLMEISATFIRNALKQKKDIRFFLPKGVWEYIIEMHFYEK